MVKASKFVVTKKKIIFTAIRSHGTVMLLRLKVQVVVETTSSWN